MIDYNDVIKQEDYKKIFQIIYNKHHKYCENWLKNINVDDKINLSSNLICDIYCPENGVKKFFIDYMNSYYEELPNLYVDILDENDRECKFAIRGRTKSMESIIYKVVVKNKNENGKFPINKCLNDLLGLRIIDNGYDNNIEYIKQCLNELKDQGYNIKHMTRNNKGYKAYHIYFKGTCNNVFPVELQIWDKKDELNNIESHKIYKQRYIETISEYKKN